MSTAAESRTFNIEEPIPGYRVRERIGAGGYGEVWKAEAPGGIAKAIKVVYGYRDDERASRELNALNRIKEVRHPFLLSLERIEHVDGHLVIVAELATASLKDVFQQCRQSGLIGIPRGELLSHLHDAADALDYICEEHSLQHLDVKPENLLLVGGRIKVADFGLVKDLQDVNSSIVGGLTPVYAAPELFDGRPGRHSDQYSLAIVYQEMLTGVLPYEGRTTAQLAAQHLHSRPRLDRLPASDQATVAKALSKDPEQRYSSCRDMIDSLLEATPNHRPQSPRVAARMGGDWSSQAVPTDTEILTPELIRAKAAEAMAPVAVRTQPAEPVPATLDLPPLEIKPEDVEYRPAIFVGVGGFAARTLHVLQRRLVDRFGDLRLVPSLQMLLFETDAETLKSVTEGGGPTSLREDSAILLPLRQTADYRRESGGCLQWLSRRWIYNIPRSSQTQSFRPLGRLALVDHLDRVMERIGRAIRAAVDGQGLAASAQKTGLPFRHAAPRIFIVSSISGGTGSGMVLDLAYVIRKTLRDLDLPEDGLCGILAHCIGRNSQTRDIAVANAYAFLAELNHYSGLEHAYPGDPSGGLPAFVAEDAPFNHAYVVQLGEDLEQDEFAAAADKLAQYLYCNAVTPAGTFFDKCRMPQSTGGCTASAQPTVRTFGLCQLGFAYDDIPITAADEICRALVLRWQGTDQSERKDRGTSLSDPTALLATQFSGSLSREELQAEVAPRMEAAGLSVARIVDQLSAVATRELDDDRESYLFAVLEELLGNHNAAAGPSSRFPPAKLVLDTLDSLIRPQGMQLSRGVCLESVLESYLLEMAAGQAKELREWILGLVASPKHRVAGAQSAADCACEHLREFSHQAGESAKAVLQKLQTLRETILNANSRNCNWVRRRGLPWRRRRAVDRRLSQYFRLTIEELTLSAVCRLTGLILTQIASLSDRLRNFSAELNRVAEDLQQVASPADGGPKPAGEDSQARRHIAGKTIADNKAALVAEMEIALEDQLHHAATTDDTDMRPVLLHRLRSTARLIILRLFKTVALREIAAAGRREPDRAASAVRGSKAASPGLSHCGGARRRLLIAPDSISPADLVAQLGGEASEAPTVVADTENDVILFEEVESLPLARVAAAILDNRFQNVEIASRLHTRVDVPWTPL